MGLDPSVEFLTIARELAREARLDVVVEFREGSALALPFADGEFDVALAATVLVHVPGAAAAVPEMARVVRSGGRVGIFDFDGDSLVISHPDRALTRRIVAAFSDATLSTPAQWDVAILCQVTVSGLTRCGNSSAAS